MYIIFIVHKGCLENGIVIYNIIIIYVCSICFCVLLSILLYFISSLALHVLCVLNIHFYFVCFCALCCLLLQLYV